MNNREIKTNEPLERPSTSSLPPEERLKVIANLIVDLIIESKRLNKPIIKAQLEK